MRLLSGSSFARSIAAGMAIALLGASVLGSQATLAASVHPSEDAIRAWNAAAMGYGAAGTYMDDSTGELVALMPSTAVASQSSTLVMTKAAALGVKARVVRSAIDKPTVDLIMARLAGLRSEIPQTYAYAFYFDASQQKIILDTAAPSSLFSAVLDDFSAYIILDPSPIQRYSRTSDFAPHWGGAALEGPGQTNGGWPTYCTSGFTVLKNGSRYMLTAGHCFTAGSNLYNYAYSGGQYGSGYYMGYITRRTDTIDAELMYGSTYAPSIYTTNTSSVSIIGAGDPVLGFTSYCHSGVYSTTSCGHKAIAYGNVCYEYCVNVYTLIYGSPPTNGDSGGPLYVMAGFSTAQARGMIVGGSGNVFWATGWSLISNYFGVTIAT